MTYPPNPTAITMSGYAAANLVELLEHCDRFLRTASPAVRAELCAFLAAQPNRPDAGWLIDMLGFNALYLQARLALEAAATTLAGTSTGAES